MGALILVIYEVGFIGEVTAVLHWLTAALVVLFSIEQAAGLLRNRDRRGYTQAWGLHIGIAAITTVVMVALISSDWLQTDNKKLSILLYGVIQGAILTALTLRALRHQAQITSLNIRPGWLLMGSFALIIMVGTGLLKLPRAVMPGEHLSWLDAFFTSTSAVCVTGLAVANTANFFSPTGQVIVLCLIQIGGLGIMTLTFFLANMLFQGGSLHDRKLLGEMISEKHLAQVATSVRFIVLFTFIAEALGGIMLFQVLPNDRGIGERIFQAIFHTVSAFCNAGFSTLPDGLADRWIVGNYGVQMIVGALVICGGLGSLVVRDTVGWVSSRVRSMHERTHNQRRLRVHTRFVWIITGGLLVAGAVAIYVSEFVLYSGSANAGRALTAFFHSMTARTAGFNTVDTGAIGPVTAHIIVLLMVIGGSPGGTAGGMRTTVFASAALHLWNQLRMVPNLVVFRRRLPSHIGPHAAGVVLLTVSWLVVNFAVLRQLQPDVTDTRLMFELVSAFGTVGLSMNLTGELTSAAKGLIILNMFIGRIGLIAVASTLIPVNPRRQVQRPVEDILLF